MGAETLVEQNVDLASLTTIRLGGKAKFFASCKTVDDLREAVEYARENNLRIHVLSGGSNTIFQDDGFDGLVIKVDLKGIEWALRQAQGQQQLIRVAAGEDWDAFVAQCVEKDLAGVECMSGIPGSVGATPIQNVAAYGQQVSDVIVEVKTLEVGSLEERVFLRDECNFDHRSSRFKYEDVGKYIITEVLFQFVSGGGATVNYPQVREALGGDREPTLENMRETVLGLRRKKSMVIDEADPNTRSCGSFFENPLREEISGEIEVVTYDENNTTRVPSAWLIEQVGYGKGYRHNGIGISPNHNLALVNYGGTTAELLDFAEELKAAVKERFGVELKREPVVVE